MQFKDAAYRLTLLYVLILFILSLSYSIWLYNTAGNEISWVVAQVDGSGVGAGVSNVSDSFNTVHNSKDRVLLGLVFFNLFILGAGTLVSYALARFTLKPIQKSYEAQANFAMHASHELRTPLTALKAELQLAKRAPHTSKEMQQTIQSSLAEVDRLSKLTERLLRLASPAPGGYEKQPSSLLTAIAVAEKAVSASISQKEIQVRQPNTDTRLAIAADDLSEVLTIVLHNAAKYSPKRSQITIAYNSHDTLCEVRISDNGPGISPQDLPYIFDPFYRAPTAKGHAGSGLGLAIAKNILTHSGASISAVSANGTTIILQIPTAASV